MMKNGDQILYNLGRDALNKVSHRLAKEKESISKERKKRLQNETGHFNRLKISIRSHMNQLTIGNLKKQIDELKEDMTVEWCKYSFDHLLALMPWAFPEYLQKASSLEPKHFAKLELHSLNLRQMYRGLERHSFNNRGKGIDHEEKKFIDKLLHAHLDEKGRVTEEGAKLLLEYFDERKGLQKEQTIDYWRFLSSELASIRQK